VRKQSFCGVGINGSTNADFFGTEVQLRLRYPFRTRVCTQREEFLDLGVELLSMVVLLLITFFSSSPMTFTQIPKLIR
jgi:hypothetical protein